MRTRLSHALCVISFSLSITACHQPMAEISHYGEHYFGDRQERRQVAEIAEPHSITVVKRAGHAAQLIPGRQAERITVSSVASNAYDGPDGDGSGIQVTPLSISSRDLTPPTLPVRQQASTPQQAYQPAASRVAMNDTTLRQNTHRLASGETLYRLSKRYGVSVDAIRRANHIDDMSNIPVGRELIIPSSTTPRQMAAAPHSPASAKPERQSRASSQPQHAMLSAAHPQPKPPQTMSQGETSLAMAAPPTVKPLTRQAPRQFSREAVSSEGFIWPVHGEVVSQFGNQGSGLYNDGINIRTSAGKPVRAAADGEIVYAGNKLSGYGNLVIIKHANGYLTAYAHMEQVRVAKGDKVTQGQEIAQVGSTGDVSSPQLHFGIRKGQEPVDPMMVLKVEKGINTALR